MTARVAALWRHPIKGHGRESLQTVTLSKGQTIPWDRRWAVAHELAQAETSDWSPCTNFSRGSKVAALMAINARCDETTGQVTLTHPNRPDLTFDPDRETGRFLDWVRPLMPANRMQSTRILRVENRGMTDTDYPSISLLNLASNDTMTETMQQEVSPLRWRCNIHMSGLEPWVEFDWIGKTVNIGEAELTIREPILRCLATTANPDTGERDADTLATLNSNFGHQNFGIYAEVTRSGDITLNDRIEVLG
jgi:uncharacterized protein YcbX